MDQEIIAEKWMRIDGYSDYEISNLGRVKSYRRRSVWKKGAIRILSGNYDAHGYYRVKIVSDEGIKKNKKIHQLVNAAFNKTNGAVVRHLDGNKQNNRSDNLAAGTYAENTADAIMHGTHTHGTKHHSNVLSEIDVLDIFDSDIGIKELASKYKVSEGMIRHIKLKRKWKYLLSDRKARDAIKGSGDYR